MARESHIGPHVDRHGAAEVGCCEEVCKTCVSYELRYGQCNLLEHYPCVVVSAGSLHLDPRHCTKARHREVDILRPVVLGNTKDPHFGLLLQGPVPSSITRNRSVRCIPVVWTLT